MCQGASLYFFIVPPKIQRYQTWYIFPLTDRNKQTLLVKNRDFNLNLIRRAYLIGSFCFIILRITAVPLLQSA
jgi:hypothetical protein